LLVASPTGVAKESAVVYSGAWRIGLVAVELKIAEIDGRREGATKEHGDVAGIAAQVPDQLIVVFAFGVPVATICWFGAMETLQSFVHVAFPEIEIDPKLVPEKCIRKVSDVPVPASAAAAFTIPPEKAYGASAGVQVDVAIMSRLTCADVQVGC
jgi:hypothetical protein